MSQVAVARWSSASTGAGVGETPGVGVGEEADPAGAGADGGEAIREQRTELPRAVAAHRMAGEVDALRVRVQLSLGQVQNFQGIQSSPGFPIKAIGPAIGRRDEMAPAFRRVGVGLADGFHARAVDGKKERRSS